MGTDQDRLQCLIENARLLIDFNSSAGILPSSRLEETLLAVEALNKEGRLAFDSREAIALRGEVLRMVTAIKPATIRDLQDFPPFTSRGKKTADRGRKSWWVRLRPLAYLAGAVLVLLTCAYYTVWAKSAEQLMRDVQAVQQQLASERYQEIVNRWARVPFSEQSATDSALQLSANAQRNFLLLANHLETFRNINERATRLRASVLPFAAAPVQVGIPDRVAPEPGTGLPDAAPPPAAEQVAGQSDTPDPASSGLAGDQPGAAQDYLRGRDADEACFQSYVDARDRLLSLRPRQAPEADSSLVDQMALLAFNDWASEQMYKAHLQLMRCTLNLDPRFASQLQLAISPSHYIATIRWVRNLVDILSTWVLPGLYGMLGAILVSLQSQQDPLHPPQRDSRILSRVFLGGFIGLVVGWFWSPQSSELFEFANINVGLFTVAFVFGYGADVFLSLMQRLVQALSSAVESGSIRT